MAFQWQREVAVDSREVDSAVSSLQRVDTVVCKGSAKLLVMSPEGPDRA